MHGMFPWVWFVLLPWLLPNRQLARVISMANKLLGLLKSSFSLEKCGESYKANLGSFVSSCIKCRDRNLRLILLENLIGSDGMLPTTTPVHLVSASWMLSVLILDSVVTPPPSR
jgi:hypothetical protein